MVQISSQNPHHDHKKTDKELTVQISYQLLTRIMRRQTKSSWYRLPVKSLPKSKENSQGADGTDFLSNPHQNHKKTDNELMVQSSYQILTKIIRKQTRSCRYRFPIKSLTES